MPRNPLSPEEILARKLVADWSDESTADNLYEAMDDAQYEFAHLVREKLLQLFPSADPSKAYEVGSDAWSDAMDAFYQEMRDSLVTGIPHAASSKARPSRKKKKKKRTKKKGATKKKTKVAGRVHKKLSKTVSRRRSMQRSKQPTKNPRSTIDQYLKKI